MFVIDPWPSYSIVTSKRISFHRKIWQTSIIVVPYACSTIHMATIWLLPKDAINDNEIPTATGVLGSLMHPPAWETGLSLTAFALNICMADCVVVSLGNVYFHNTIGRLIKFQIWRCWTVWGRRWVVVVLPILCSVTGAGELSHISSLEVGPTVNHVFW